MTMTDQPTPDPAATVTVTAAHVEAALRGWLAMFEYDLHKGLECGEEDGADHYPEEAADLFERLRTAATVTQPAPAADVTVYELRTGSDDDPRPEIIARYATHIPAALHAEAQYRAAYGYTATLEWPPTGTDDNPRYRLMAVDDLDGNETLTDWHIVPVTIPTTYTPAGGAR